MGVINPDEMLKRTVALQENITHAKKMIVKVGLPVEKVSSKAYEGGLTLVKNAAIHEYGLGNSPSRSFLYTPFRVKKKEIAAFIQERFIKVKAGYNPDKMLGLIGVFTTNISKEAFRNNGYGTWPELSEQTIMAKGSSRPLIDKGILRSNITWVVAKK